MYCADKEVLIKSRLPIKVSVFAKALKQFDNQIISWKGIDNMTVKTFCKGHVINEDLILSNIPLVREYVQPSQQMDNNSSLSQ